MTQLPITALAVSCSDGRLAGPVDDFIRGDLGIERCDRIALPGGPGSLIERDGIDGPRGVLGELAFLVEAHELDRVILIAHAGCAAYEVRLGAAGERGVEIQLDEMQDVAGAIVGATGAAIEGYLARPGPSGFTFESVPGALGAKDEAGTADTS